MGASRVIPPREGLIGVLQLVGTTPSSAVAIQQAGYHVFVCDEPFYITFGNSSVAAPDETATTGNSRTMRWPADTPLAVYLSGIEDSHFRVKPTGNSFLRWWKG